MIVEIAICTWNRASSLDVTLQHICKLTIPDEVKLRVIVVDNSSTDVTQQVIERYQDQCDLIPLQEQRQGHSFARNCAVQAMAGDLVLWIDDDVTVNDDWLAAYCRAVVEDNDVSFWGGPILPKFVSGMPKWIEDNWEKVQGCFAYRDLGGEAIALCEDQLPYGANFAVRTDVQKKFLFDSSLGRTSTSVVGEDELMLMRNLVRAGFQGRWIPDARVEHLIDADRATTSFIANYFVGQGRAMVGKGAAWTTDQTQLQQEARHEMFWYRAKRWFARSEVWLSHLIRGSLAKGQLLAMQESKT